MRRRQPELDPELEAFVTARKIVPAVPPEIRVRALNRAKRIIATGGAAPVASRSDVPAPKRPPVTAGRLVRPGLTVSVALVAGTVGAMMALHRPSVRITPPPASDVTRPVPGRSEAGVTAQSEDPRPVGEPQASAARVHRAFGEGDPVAAELRLLQRAQTAYAQRDCSSALVVLAEHARRFPRSHLAEEREALRVRSLGCAGHRQEAERAAARFAARFPRSVLLPRAADGERTVE